MGWMEGGGEALFHHTVSLLTTPIPLLPSPSPGPPTQTPACSPVVAAAAAAAGTAAASAATAAAAAPALECVWCGARRAARGAGFPGGWGWW